MTDKQIIINGVDVSECSYYQHNMCTATKDDYGDCSLCCQDYDMNDCYYKQLKRKEQECEELKSENFTFEELIKTQEELIDNYKQAFGEIKNYVRDNSDFDKSDKLTSNTGAYDILEIINKKRTMNI